MKVGGYLTDVGATLAGTDIVDVNWLTGATKFVMFLVTGDVLDQPVYDRAELSSANHDLAKFFTAIEVLKRI